MNHNLMRKILLFLVPLFALFSCQNTTKIESQITADLVGMLHNKVEVQELSIKRISTTDDQTKTIIFDCALYFIDDLYKDDGTLAFKKGMRVIEKSNAFTYVQNAEYLKLVRLQFGQTTQISQ